MGIEEKAKTFEVPMQQCLSCGEIIPDTHEDAVSHSRAKHDVITNFRQIKVSMILFSVAQQEIDKLEKENWILRNSLETLKKSTKTLLVKMEKGLDRLEGERGLQKQKLTEIKKALVPHADTCRKCVLRPTCSKQWKSHPSYQCNAIENLGNAYHFLREFERSLK
jgi:hypothetical protein